MTEVFDHTVCTLGEGPLWHPQRQELFWFDVLNGRMHTRGDGKLRTVQFKEFVSSAGWVSDTELLIASEKKLFLFDIESERMEDVEGLEPDDPTTRSNDGRADPWGGFWISTMGKDARSRAGTIYRYFQGRLTPLYPQITIPNAIAFAPDRTMAYFADTTKRQVMRQKLDPNEGWPEGDPEVFLDLQDEGLNPDGAVVDAAGNFWNAQWGAWRVACYSPDGVFQDAISFDAAQTSCPAFGGPGLSTLFCTSARENLSDHDAGRSENHGKVFAAPETGAGQPEWQVTL